MYEKKLLCIRPRYVCYNKWILQVKLFARDFRSVRFVLFISICSFLYLHLSLFVFHYSAQAFIDQTITHRIFDDYYASLEIYCHGIGSQQEQLLVATLFHFHQMLTSE